MKSKCLVLALTAALSGCATSGSDFGEIAVDTVRAHHRANRAAITGTLALLGEAVGYRRGPVIERRITEREAATLRSESGVDPTLTQRGASHWDERGRRVESPAMQSIQMDVGVAEMLTPDGTLHARAARALARMDNMAREHGGDFSVLVPRSKMHSAAAIRAVAPGAAIYETDTDGNFRLIVVAAER